MATPNKIEKFRDLETDFGTTIAEANWKKAVQLMNYINASYPIGRLLFFHATQSNLPHTPDSKYWQEVDGTMVSNVNSLLNGVTLPDYRDMFFRNIKTGETVLSTGGATTVNLTHDHGAVTGSTDPRTTFDADDGDERTVMTPHTHAVSSESMPAVSTIPLFIALKVYVRIV
jgi:hypothetical protein